MAVESAPTCFHHRDRATGRACTRCGRPACFECLHDAPVGAHCFECIKAARPPLQQRAKVWSATAGAVATKTLVAANLAVFVLTTAQGSGGATSLSGRWALYGPLVAHGEWYRLITGGFVHEGLIHVGFNMLLLYRFGAILEPALGRARFLALYAASLLAGSFGVMLLAPHSVTVGASGAVFGIVGATAVGLRERGVNVWQSGVGGLLAINLALTVLVPGISIGAHFGGLIGGVIVGAAMFRSDRWQSSTLAGLTVAAAVILLSLFGALAAAQR